MSTVEVLPGVRRIRIRMGYVNAYLIDGDELTLVDTGLPGLTETFLRAIRDAGRDPRDLRHIAVTHHHTNHAGSLAPLAAAVPDAAIYAHPLDIPIISGEQPVAGPNPDSRLGKVIGRGSCACSRRGSITSPCSGRSRTAPRSPPPAA